MFLLLKNQTIVAISTETPVVTAFGIEFVEESGQRVCIGEHGIISVEIELLPEDFTITGYAFENGELVLLPENTIPNE